MLSYVPQESMGAAEALRVVQRTLEQQPGNLAPFEVEVTLEKVAVTVHLVKRRVLGLGVTTVPHKRLLYFDSILKWDLARKRRLYQVRVWDTKRHVLVAYSLAQEEAERFLDAVHVLAGEALALNRLPFEERMRRIGRIERQRKQLEIGIEGVP